MDQDLLVGIVAGGSAVLGAVCAQIVSVVGVAKHEVRRLGWERERANVADRIELTKTAYESKLRSCALVIGYLHDLERYWLRSPEDPVGLRNLYRSIRDDLFRTTLELELIAPSLNGAMTRVAEELAALNHLEASTPVEELRHLMDRLEESAGTLRRQMQQSLGVENAPVVQTTAVARRSGYDNAAHGTAHVGVDLAKALRELSLDDTSVKEQIRLSIRDHRRGAE